MALISNGFHGLWYQLQERIRRLLSLSQNARALAHWCEKYPDKFYWHELCPTVDEKAKLTVVQVCYALGYNLFDHKSCVLKLKERVWMVGKVFLNHN